MGPGRATQRAGAAAAACIGVVLGAAPSGAVAQGLLGDINGTPTGGVTFVANTWQQYSYTFAASQSASFLTFLFRNDPDFNSLDDISITRSGTATNLLQNPGLETPGVVSNGVLIPAGWVAGSARLVSRPEERSSPMARPATHPSLRTAARDSGMMAPSAGLTGSPNPWASSPGRPTRSPSFSAEPRRPTEQRSIRRSRSAYCRQVSSSPVPLRSTRRSRITSQATWAARSCRSSWAGPC